MTSQNGTQFGFVLDSVHNQKHVLCFELPARSLDLNIYPFCIHCVLHALQAEYELSLSKRALYSVLINFFSKSNEAFITFTEHTELVASLLSFSCKEANFHGHTSSMADREALLTLFEWNEQTIEICLLFLSNVSVLQYTHSVPEIRWFISVMEHFSVLMTSSEVVFPADIENELCTSFFSVIRELIGPSFNSILEQDKIRLFHTMRLLQYRPEASEKNFFSAWLLSQLERASTSPMLAYRLLDLWKTIPSDLSIVSSNCLSVLNYYLVHEANQISSTAQVIFTSLVNSETRMALMAADSPTYAMESAISVLSNYDTEAEDTDLILTRGLDTLFFLHRDFHDVFNLNMNDVVRIIYSIAFNSTACAIRAIRMLQILISDATLCQLIHSDSLETFIVQYANEHVSTTEGYAEMLALAEKSISSKIIHSPISLANDLHSLSAQALRICVEYLNETVPSIVPNSDTEIPNLMNSLFSFVCRIASIQHPELESTLDQKVCPIFLIELDKIIVHEQATQSILGLFLELLQNSHLTSWFLKFLEENPFLAFLAKADRLYPKCVAVQSVLKATLERIFVDDLSNNHVHWVATFCCHSDDLQTRPWFEIRGAVANLSETTPESLFYSTIDLLFLSLLFGAEAFVLYLLDSYSDYGRATSHTTWRQKIQWAFLNFLNVSILCSLSPSYLVRLCMIWSCSSEQGSVSDKTVNQIFVDAMGGSTFAFLDLLLPVTFKCFKMSSSLPTSFVSWLLDHSKGGTTSPSLRLLKEINNSEIDLVRGFLELLSNHPKCIQLLIDAYISNAVCKPILTPLEALNLIFKCCQISMLKPLNANQTPSNQYYRVNNSSAIGKMLIHNSFPLDIPTNWKKTLEVEPLHFHAQVVTFVLLSSLDTPSCGQENLQDAKNQALFMKFWKSLESIADTLSMISQRTISDVKSDLTQFYGSLDLVVTDLFNLWNILLSLNPPSSLVFKLLETRALKQLCTFYRPDNQFSTKFDQTINTMHSLRNLPKHDSVFSVSSEVLNSMHISLYQLVLASHSGSDCGSEHLLSNRLFCLLQSLRDDNPVFKLTAAHSIGVLAPIYIRKASFATTSFDELKVALLAIVSSLLSVIVHSSEGLLTEACMKSLLATVNATTCGDWLVLPQIHLLLLRYLHSPSMAAPLSKTGSMYILGILCTFCRSKPTQIPKKLMVEIVAPRTLRKLLIPVELNIFRINLLSLYKLLRCGLWKNIVKRDTRDGDGMQKSLRIALDGLLRNSTASQTQSRASKRHFLSFNRVMVPEKLMSADDGLDRHFEARRWVSCLRSWLDWCSSK